MKDHMNYYKHYEKLMKTNLCQSIETTPEYHSFSEAYPRITESIRLKREIERLTNKVEYEKERSVRIEVKKEINIAKTKLKRNNLFKRLHGDSKQEAKFHRKLKLRTVKKHISYFAKKYYMRLRCAIANFRKKYRRSMHRHLPPSVFNLKELDVTEKSLALREWIQEKRKNGLHRFSV